MGFLKKLSVSGKAGLLAALAGLALGAYTYFNPAALAFCVSRVTFYCMFALFACWVTALARPLAAGFDRRAFLKDYGAGLLLALALAALVFLALKPQFRVLSDETNLLSVSKSMLYERRADNVTTGKWYYFNFQPITRETEKRPYMFPFFTYLVHAASGYRASNPFALNFFLLFSLLSGVYALFRRRAGAALAGAAVLLTAAQPVIGLVATSAGMEMMFLAFVFFSFLALRRHLAAPGRDSFLLLWTTLLITANVRYEGPVFLAAALAGLAVFRKLKAEWLDSWAVWLAPFVLLPVFWQRFCLSTNYENPEGVPVFSAAAFLKHTADFLSGALGPGFFYPYAAVVDAAGFAGLAYFGFRFFRRSWPQEEADRQLAWITLAGLAAFWVVTAAYYLGDPLHQSAARLFCPPVLALSLLAAALLAALPVFRDRTWLAVLAAAAMFLVYCPVAAENRFMNFLYLGREYRQELDFFGKLGTRDILIVASRPGQFTPHNYGAVDFPYARENSAQLLDELDRHLYARLFVIQKISYASQEPVEDTGIGGFTLQPAFEFQETEAQYVRVSEASRR